MVRVHAEGSNHMVEQEAKEAVKGSGFYLIILL
jgi:hypothetical protein